MNLDEPPKKDRIALGSAPQGGVDGAATILLVDDDPLVGRLSKMILGPLDLPMQTATTGTEAIAFARDRRPALVVLDVGLPDVSGLAVLEQLLALRQDLPIIMLTGEDDAPTAVRALRLGAFDYLTKPVNHEELLLSAQRALEHGRLVGEVSALRAEVRSTFIADRMGPSAEIAALSARVNQVAVSSMSVLVLGETGAGKELVAQAIHRASARRECPFVAVDCGAIPETLLESELFGHEEGAFTGARRRQKGRFQHAEGGTLFLDEIGNLSAANQAKLLRVLEERRLRPLGGGQPVDIDIRIVAATNEDLEQRVRRNEFRQDLYYRLAEYTIRLPPLRERPADIAHLAQRFCVEAATELQKRVSALDGDAIALLREHAWPGNARELRNVVRQAVLACGGSTILAAHLGPLLPPSARPGGHLSRTASAAAPASDEALAGRSLREITDQAVEAAERHALEHAMRATAGCRADAARTLQIDAKTLYRKLKRYGLQ